MDGGGDILIFKSEIEKRVERIENIVDTIMSELQTILRLLEKVKEE